MRHDSDFCARRAAEARAAAARKGGGEGAEIQGHLALAYALLARRRLAAAETVEPAAEQPLLLQE